MATTTYTPIETQTLGSAASSITFGSGETIPQTYTDLIIVANTKNTANNGDEVGIRFNGDTGNNYSRTRLYGNGSSAASDRSTNTNKGALQINSTSDFTPLIAHIQNYSNLTTYKTVISRGNSGGYVSAYVSLWRNTNRITSITLLPDSGTTFTSGCTFTLYGIANAAIGAPKATGGIITYDNTYYYHTFGASGTFTPQQSLTADILVVAGGGGGSDGGGGAGGVVALASQSLTATGYTVTVGNGGAAGSNGGNSQFGSLTAAVGGGAGLAYNAGNGASGGSGGGAPRLASGSSTGGSPQSGQGYAGGNSGSGSNVAGGGGGAGAVGQNGTGTYPTGTGGAGGNGISTYSSWLQTTGIGQNVSGTYYIAGGGGGFNQPLGPAAGGLGGGGQGSTNTGGATAGAVNTGSGGGANGGGGVGTGGSGVVIIRYLKA